MANSKLKKPGNRGLVSTRRTRPQLRKSNSRALRIKAVLMQANDGAIDDYLELIDSWEALTGRSVLPRLDEAKVPSRSLAEPEGLFAKAQFLLKLKSRQDAAIPIQLRHEPILRMLLELYCQDYLGERTSSKRLCLSSGCPNSTALRYIEKMEAFGLVQRERSDCDRRLTLLTSTNAGLRMATDILNVKSG